jgi:rRNA-processing protein FCF1
LTIKIPSNMLGQRNFRPTSPNLYLQRTLIRKTVTLKVIFDSNFFFVPSQFRIDIFEDMMTLLNQKYEPVVLSTTLQELQRMAEEGSPKLRKQAVTALKLAEKCQVFDVERRRDETSDDVIVRIAAQWRSPVATNDRELRRRLRDLDVPVIFLRGKNRLELEGAL